MNKIALLAAIAALSACSKSPAPPADETSTSPAVSASVNANIAADGKSSTGTFTITTHDGKRLTEVVKPDGTYAISSDGKVVETGKWEQKSTSIYCYTADAAGSAQICNTEKVENGVWSSKTPDGKVETVERIGD